jgi:hypothetical protein
VNRKGIALILSGIFPGLGQLYNRQWTKGAGLLIAGVGLSWLVSRALPRDLDVLASTGLAPSSMAAAIVLLAVWIYSLVDAWRGA